MTFLKTAALVATGATGMHLFDKRKQNDQVAPPQGQQQAPGQYYQMPSPNLQAQQTPGEYYQMPSPNLQAQQSTSQHQSANRRAIEASGYVHQSYCNGTCGESCNGRLNPVSGERAGEAAQYKTSETA